MPLPTLTAEQRVEALPGVGAVKANQMLTDLAIADTRRIGGLGANQREALLAVTA